MSARRDGDRVEREVDRAIVEPLRAARLELDDLRAARLGAGIEARLDAVAGVPRARRRSARVLLPVALAVAVAAGTAALVRRPPAPPAAVAPPPSSPPTASAARAATDRLVVPAG